MKAVQSMPALKAKDFKERKKFIIANYLKWLSIPNLINF